MSLPFLLVGLSLTVRRLRDAGLPLWLLPLFFVPVVNLVFFVVLSLLPSRAGGHPEEPAEAGLLSRVIPKSKLWSALAAVVLTAVVGLALTVLATEALMNYGWGLFVGIPFCLGLLAALIHGYHTPRDAAQSIGVASAAAALASGALLFTGIEGAICVLMALPLTVPLAILGGLTGYAVQRSAWSGATATNSIASVVFVLPLLLGFEADAERQPRILPVTTRIVVEAPPRDVWRHVIAFPELPPPDELVFRAGVAYPVGARIDGRGVGAVRRCRFSTGDFVEPITVWQAPRLLRFGVRSQPAPMRELSPWGEIRPPHLDGFLRSYRGEFRLTPLPGGRTLLEGTTWYENRMWPASYWRLWSDALIHRIHLRVLRHVRLLSEQDHVRRAG